jgi:hypothetical protein
MITREQVEDLAKVAAEKMAILQGMAACNVYGLTPSERIDVDARYMMARSEALAAENAYQKAMAGYLTQPGALTTAA